MVDLLRDVDVRARRAGHLRIKIAWALVSFVACTNSDALSRTHAAMLLADPVHLGQDYAGDVFAGEIVVRSVGDGPLRILSIEADHPELLFDWSGDVVTVLPQTTFDITIVWEPATAGPLDTFVTVVSDAEQDPVGTVRVLGNALPIPACDGGPCRTGVFDHATETCIFTNHDGTCADNNACTLNDHCVDGACTGDQRVCDDAHACTRNMCDPQTGCIYPTDPSVCVDDGEFCTAELCNAQGECETTIVPNWTGCAPPTCLGIWACLDGVCTNWPITLDPDSCHQGEVDFGTVYVGYPARTTFTVEATATPLTISAAYTNHPEMAIDDVVGTVLAVGEPVEIPVEWRPQQEGVLQGEFVVETDGCESWVIAAHGTALPVPDCDDGNPCTTEHFVVGRGRCVVIADPGAECPSVRIAAGSFHTCGLSSTGAVKCWGQNTEGQLGDGTGANWKVPTSVAGLPSGAVAVTTGGSHTCVVLDTWDVMCWGGNDEGQLGNGTNEDQTAPVDVTGLLSEVVAISAGGRHVCALLGTGGVTCWGRNTEGQLGDGTNVGRNTPVGVVGLSSRAVHVAAGGSHTCAVLDTGGLQCWGGNIHDQLGSDRGNQNTPVGVVGLSTGVGTAACGEYHTCALLNTGTLKCWGQNWEGQLGDGTTAFSRATPVDVLGLSAGVVAVTAGYDHTCALLDTGGLKCWGSDSYGKLGNGEITGNQTTPVDVVGLSSGVAALSAGWGHVCALLDVGDLKCWGYDGYGGLGDGGTNTDQSTPVDVVGFP